MALDCQPYFFLSQSFHSRVLVTFSAIIYASWLPWLIRGLFIRAWAFCSGLRSLCATSSSFILRASWISNLLVGSWTSAFGFMSSWPCACPKSLKLSGGFAVIMHQVTLALSWSIKLTLWPYPMAMPTRLIILLIVCYSKVIVILLFYEVLDGSSKFVILPSFVFARVHSIWQSWLGSLHVGTLGKPGTVIVPFLSQLWLETRLLRFQSNFFCTEDSKRFFVIVKLSS